MAWASDILAKLTNLRGRFALKRDAGAAAPSPADPVFDARLQKLTALRPVSVSRAALFRTQSEH